MHYLCVSVFNTTNLFPFLCLFFFSSFFLVVVLSLLIGTRSHLCYLFASHSESDSDAPVERVYTRPKPKAITTHLFMWERVASFSPPEQVLELERVCYDIYTALKVSNTGTNLMQRYWNAMFVRLTWENPDTVITEAKRLLSPGSISRSEGKRPWKQLYAQEYHEWMESMKRFKGNTSRRIEKDGERLNEYKTGEELKKIQLTAEESYHKALALKRLQGENVSTGVAFGQPERKLNKGAKKLQHLTTMMEGDQRTQYKLNPKQADRAGKHKKGGTKKWADMAEDY
eukprot:gene6519-4696_t